MGMIGAGTTLMSIVGLSAAVPAPEVIPEPTTLALLGAGLLGAGAAAVRRRRTGGTSAQA